MTWMKRTLAIGAACLLSGTSLQAQTFGGGATGLGGTGGAGTAGLGGTQSTGTIAAPEITAPSTSTQTSQAINASNAFNQYYANPAFQGRAGTMYTSSNPGGFGTALYGTTGGTTGGGGLSGFAGGNTTGARFGATGGRTGGTTGATGFGGTTGAVGGGFGGTTGGFGGTTGAAGGFGGTTGRGTTGGLGGLGATGGLGGLGGARGGLGGLGGAGGFGNTGGFGQQQNGLQSPRAISYVAIPRFATPTITPDQLRTNLQTVISSSTTISNVRGVQVEAQQNGIVVLRGSVADEDEARLVEGMMLLSPGVREVKNELKFPKP
jgi:hypothetical protein